MILIKNKLYNLSKFQRKWSYGKIRFLGNILGINWNSWVTLTLYDNCIVYPIKHTCNGFERRLIWKWIWSILFSNNAKKKTIDKIKCTTVDDTYFFLFLTKDFYWIIQYFRNHLAHSSFGYLDLSMKVVSVLASDSNKRTVRKKGNIHNSLPHSPVRVLKNFIFRNMNTFNAFY